MRTNGSLDAHTAWDVCVIVPTRNEAGNVAPLVARLEAALLGRTAEVLFVDDSDDDTPAAVTAAAARAELVGAADRFRVRLLHRGPSERAGGLGGAVRDGLNATRATHVVVMDGDLQHPPEVVPDLLAALDRDLDLVVGSRYTGGGDAGGLSSGFRTLVSSGATLAARGLFPRALSRVTDPMSGLFAFRRAGVDPERLQPRGFKILLEIVARTPRLRIGEVPFTFQSRYAGDSKADWREGVRYVRQLALLRMDTRGDLGRVAPVGALALSGLVVHLVALAVMRDSAPTDVVASTLPPCPTT